MANQLDESGIRTLAQTMASELGTRLEWEAVDRSAFSSALWSGAICSPALWDFEWLDRYEVQSLLALMAGGVSLLPSSDGSAFEYVDRTRAIGRLHPFLERLRHFVNESDPHPNELSAFPEKEAQRLELGGAVGWQFAFDELSREQADQISTVLRRHVDVEAVDPGERYLLLGDRGTAQSILAMASEGASSLPNWDGDGLVTVKAEEVRARLENFMADDLALFLERSYVGGIELTEPLTEIPVMTPPTPL